MVGTYGLNNCIPKHNILFLQKKNVIIPVQLYIRINCYLGLLFKDSLYNLSYLFKWDISNEL